MNLWSLTEEWPADEAYVLKFLSEQCMEGDIRLTQERGPTLRESLAIEGEQHKMILAQDDHQQVHACAICSWRLTTEGPSVYLHSLKLDAIVRNSRVLFAGYKKLKTWLEEEPLVYTCIMSDNYRALQVLTSKRAGLPRYSSQGKVQTWILKGLTHQKLDENSVTQCCDIKDLGDLVQFWNEQAQYRELFPKVCVEDILKQRGPFVDVEVSDIFISIQHGKIVGSLVVRNTVLKKSWRIQGYSQKVALLRPWINRLAWWKGQPILPRVGVVSNGWMGSFFLSSQGESVAISLLNLARRTIGPSALLILALHERDPLFPLSKNISHVCLQSELFTVSWGEQTRTFDRPILDTACL